METPVNGNKKLVVALHRKKNVVRSQSQALSKIAKGMEDLAGAQIKRTKLMIKTDKKGKKGQMKHSEPVNIKSKKPVKMESMS